MNRSIITAALARSLDLTRRSGSRSTLALRLALIIGLSGLVPVTAHADPNEIVVEVDGLRSDHGEVRGALYTSSRGWAEEGHQVAVCAAPIHGHTASCVFHDVEPGTYAIAFLHDEDDDGGMDRDWIGIPQEGYGFSNDAAPGFGPPSFDSASFSHSGPETDLVVHARYGI